MLIQRKLLNRCFWNLSLDENDLHKIASTIRDQIADSEAKLSIEVISGSGEDIFETEDPDYFFDNKIHGIIKKVNLCVKPYYSSLNCQVSLETGSKGSAMLKVEGDNPTIASGLYRELENLLQSKESPFSCFLRFIDKNHFKFHFISLVLFSFYLFIIFKLFLNIIISKEKLTTSVNILLFSLAYIISLPFAFNYENIIKGFLPPVRFYGRITDPGSAARKRIYFISVLLLLPIITGILANISTKIFSG